MIKNRQPSIEGTVVVWDLPVRLFHWGLVAAFVAAFATAGAYGKLHQAAGYSLAALVAFRFVWGFVGNRYARFDSFVRRLAPSSAISLICSRDMVNVISATIRLAA